MSVGINSSPVILYVEDEENDILLLQCALKKARISYPLQAVRNGDEAVAYLAGQGPYANRDKYPFPALVLLDLHLPRRSGSKVLQWIRSQPHLAGLPVVIWTSSEHPLDLQQATQFGANDYVVKPCILEQTATLLQHLTTRWLPHSS